MRWRTLMQPADDLPAVGPCGRPSTLPGARCHGRARRGRAGAEPTLSERLFVFVTRRRQAKLRSIFSRSTGNCLANALARDVLEHQPPQSLGVARSTKTCSPGSECRHAQDAKRDVPESKPGPCRRLGRCLFSPFAAWFPGGATISLPCDDSASGSSQNRTWSVTPSGSQPESSTKGRGRGRGECVLWATIARCTWRTASSSASASDCPGSAT